MFYNEFMQTLIIRVYDAVTSAHPARSIYCVPRMKVHASNEITIVHKNSALLVIERETSRVYSIMCQVLAAIYTVC